ncbi:hypothetical protein TIFTF001_022355 [Ficus carica]|uniref:Uncharacterized protein n=1 Tax=Ficus carica TaxID=3494 RepID=A0AA88ALW9_FICCA|nr:hypothetical protein TIFTF001_022355 [Ficus carica]
MEEQPSLKPSAATAQIGSSLLSVMILVWLRCGFVPATDAIDIMASLEISSRPSSPSRPVLHRRGKLISPVGPIDRTMIDYSILLCGRPVDRRRCPVDRTILEREKRGRLHCLWVQGEGEEEEESERESKGEREKIEK